MQSQFQQRTRFLKEAALRHDFMGVGIARAEHMDEEAIRLEQWLKSGYHGDMGYMANHFDLRVDPTKLVPGAKTVISLIYNYYPADLPLNPLKGTSNFDLSLNPPDLPLNSKKGTSNFVLPLEGISYQTENQSPPLKGAGGLIEGGADSIVFPVDELEHFHPLKGAEELKISRYAYGEDYHKVVRRKLKSLMVDLKNEIGDFHGRVFVDSAPVMERDWAKRSGQGWAGKNTLLIHPKKGSYFFLAEIILDVELEYDHPMRDHCGTCTKCIEACPTGAISPEGYILDGSKCISYLTIELKSQIPETFKGQMKEWIFGCDICQEVCPWNRFSTQHEEPAFNMSEDLKKMKREDWIELTEEMFNGLFEKSAVKRAGSEGLTRNIKFLSPNDQ